MLWYLRHVPLLQAFEPQSLTNLASFATRHDLQRGQPIYIEGDASDRLYVTCGGRVRSTMISSGGKVVTLAHYGPGELFGEGGLAGAGPREHSVWTTTSAIIAELPMAVFADALRSSPKALLEFAQVTCRRCQTLEGRLGDLVLRDIKARLARVLLALAAEFGRATDDGTVIDLVRTHQDFADDIASTRETVCLTLSGFLRDGLVAKRGRCLVITDAPRLSALTGAVGRRRR